MAPAKNKGYRMKAAIVTHAGQKPIFGDFQEPTGRDGEVSIVVAAAALNPLSRARAAGSHYSTDGQFPFIAGVDGIGRLDNGQRVYFLLPRAPFGAMAERTVVPLDHCIAVPGNLDDAAAAAIANPGMSSWAALTERARITPGETVFINGATGASGQLAVKIARHLGAARVIATGRNAAVLASLEADATIALGQDDDALGRAFAEQFATGVDIVLDYLWGPSARALLVAAAKAHANERPLRFVQIGSVGGPEIALPAAVLRSSTIEMMGSGLGSIAMDRLIASVGAVMQAAIPAGLTLEYRQVGLVDVESAWAEQENGHRIVFVT
jgi:NADPH:quinone reductase-like Zn-dependent oxidoreductase